MKNKTEIFDSVFKATAFIDKIKETKGLTGYLSFKRKNEVFLRRALVSCDADWIVTYDPSKAKVKKRSIKNKDGNI